MSETADNTYATNSSNAAAGAPNKVAVVNDGTGDRQVVVLGAGDGTTTLNDGSVAHPLTVTPTMGSSDFYPGYDVINKGGLPLQTDEYGNLNTRGAITTDEGTHFANFVGSSVFWTIASVTFTNGSTSVTIGSGFSTADIHFGDYVRLGADAESAWGEISFINSDTMLTLVNPYTGTGGTGTMNVSTVATATGSGATLSVASGALTMAAGTTAASQTYIYGPAGSGPNLYVANLSVSQRIANQDIYAGFESQMTGTIKSFSRFHFTGTTNTQVITETGWNPTTTPATAEQETNTVTLPAGSNTSTAHNYRIDQTNEYVIFYIDDVQVAFHRIRIPHAFSMGNNSYQQGVRILNGTTPATGTSVVVNAIHYRNYDRTDVFQTSAGQQANAQVVVTTQGGISTSYVSGNANTTGTGTTSVVAASPAGLKNYITSLSISNTGLASSLITIQNGSGGGTLWQTIAPAGGGSNITFENPISTSAATALFFAAQTASTTIYVSASGYTGP